MWASNQQPAPSQGSGLVERPALGEQRLSPAHTVAAPHRGSLRARPAVHAGSQAWCRMRHGAHRQRAPFVSAATDAHMPRCGTARQTMRKSFGKRTLQSACPALRMNDTCSCSHRWRRMTNLARYGNEQGYFMGPCHWQVRLATAAVRRRRAMPSTCNKNRCAKMQTWTLQVVPCCSPLHTLHNQQKRDAKIETRICASCQGVPGKRYVHSSCSCLWTTRRACCCMRRHQNTTRASACGSTATSE